LHARAKPLIVSQRETMQGLLKSKILNALDQALLKSSIRVVVLRSKTKEGTRSMRLYYLLLVKILQG